MVIERSCSDNSNVTEVDFRTPFETKSEFVNTLARTSTLPSSRLFTENDPSAKVAEL